MGTLSPREALTHKGAAGKLQRLFREQNISVDLNTGIGLESLSVFSLNEQGQPQEEALFSSWEKLGDEERRQKMNKLMEAAEAGNLMAFRLGVEQPLSIRFAADQASVVGEVQKPNKPGFFKSLFHAINSKWFKTEFDQYKTEKSRYDMAKKKADFYQQEHIKSAHQEQLGKAERDREAGERDFEAAVKTVQQQLEKTYGNLAEANADQFITIDGKTLALCARHHQERETRRSRSSQAQEQVYENAARYVTAALVTGKNVELHVPLGEKQEKAITLSRKELGIPNTDSLRNAGKLVHHELDMDETLDMGERHRRIDETRLLVEKKRFLDEMELYSGNSGLIQGQIVNEWLDGHTEILHSGQSSERLEQLPSEAHGFSVTRGSIGSHAIGLLMAEGKKIEDILNPALLQEEKAEAGSRFLNTLMIKDPKTGQYQGDSEKLAEMNVKGRLALKAYLDSAMKNVDFTDDAVLYSDKFRMMVTAANTLFDLNQESDKIKAPIQTYLDKQYPGKAQQMVQELDYAAFGVPASMAKLALCQRNMVECALGNQSNGMACASALYGNYIGQKLTQMIKDNPGKNPTTLMETVENKDLTNCASAVIGSVSKTLKNIGTELRGKELSEFGRRAIFGHLAKDLIFTHDETGTATVNLKSEVGAGLQKNTEKQPLQMEVPSVNAVK